MALLPVFENHYEVVPKLVDVTDRARRDAGYIVGILTGAEFRAKTKGRPGQIRLQAAYSSTHASHDSLRGDLDAREQQILIQHRGLDYRLGGAQFCWIPFDNDLFVRDLLAPAHHENVDPEGYHHLKQALGLALGIAVIQRFSDSPESAQYAFGSNIRYVADVSSHRFPTLSEHLEFAATALERGF